jgi:hypothetical protein
MCSNDTYIAKRAYTMVMGSNVSDWGERGALFTTIRHVLQNYTQQFNVSVWDADAHWFDLYLCICNKCAHVQV